VRGEEESRGAGEAGGRGRGKELGKQGERRNKIEAK